MPTQTALWHLSNVYNPEQDSYLNREGVRLVDLSDGFDGFLVFLEVVSLEEWVLQCPDELAKPREVLHRLLGKASDGLRVERHEEERSTS